MKSAWSVGAALLGLASLGMLLGSCGGTEAGAVPHDTAASTASPETRLVIVTSDTTAPLPTIAPQLVSDCLAYVPYAAFTGNFYMQAIWNIANQDVETLRTVCEEMGHTDPAGLQRISDEKQAVDRFYASLATTTVPGAPGQSTAPGAPACSDGYVMTDTGHCQAITP